ncbi:hypothetical protein Mic7113_6805 (plasmid) [Allocoleopsis franciscana PCC 7113]|uniref:Uncharacterized protein n=1 Tax=Allocoleopsis franciscana PCC 7113 TaxID=1173027 RepID=K9WS27_9CYAN|nr:hypothetical protein Mic7113_6805 [Allocoleopsis franciscana PCC 7113]
MTQLSELSGDSPVTHEKKHRESRCFARVRIIDW